MKSSRPFHLLLLTLILSFGIVTIVPVEHAEAARRNSKLKKIPIPTPRPERWAAVPKKGPIPRTRPAVTDDARERVAQARKSDRFQAIPTYAAAEASDTGNLGSGVVTGDDRDERAVINPTTGHGELATPGADLPPQTSTDLEQVNPGTIAPGVKVPSLNQAFRDALKSDPKFCRNDIKALQSGRTIQNQNSSKYDLNDYIRAGVKAGASEDQMRQTLAAYTANKGQLPNQKYLAIIDYSKRSNQKRMFVLNMEENTVKAYHVAHGKGSDPRGRGVATKFSDKAGSKKSSLGCVVAGGFYNGGNGKSLILHGLEDSNENSCARSVVMHGADYVGGSPGRSWGCPAVKIRDRKEVFNKLSHGGLICSFNGSDRG